MFRPILISLLLVACTQATTLAPLRKPDGSWHLNCGATLNNCVRQAEDLCKGRGYVVLSGMSKRKLYGADLGHSQYEVREAELDVACADRRGELPTVEYVAPAPVAPAPVVVPVAPAAVAPAPVAPAPVAPVPVAPTAVAPVPVAPAAVAPAPVVAPVAPGPRVVPSSAP
jgi:hypothetical protein